MKMITGSQKPVPSTGTTQPGIQTAHPSRVHAGRRQGCCSHPARPEASTAEHPSFRIYQAVPLHPGNLDPLRTCILAQLHTSRASVLTSFPDLTLRIPCAILCRLCALLSRAGGQHRLPDPSPSTAS